MASFDVEKIGDRTGCLMQTLDGSGDEKILPQGLTNYSFLPEHANLAPQNVKGDFNDRDVAEVNEAGLIGELEEVVEDFEEEEEEEESSDEEEEALQVDKILSCQWVGRTIKYLCTYKDCDPEDTSLEPQSNIEPKSVLKSFQEAEAKKGLFPPPKPQPKKKVAGKASGEPSGSRRSKRARGSINNWMPTHNFDDEEEELELEEEEPEVVEEEEEPDVMDLCDSDVEVPKAPELICGPCDFGKPNIAECVAADLPGRICGEVGCHLRVHHLCLINCSETKGKPAFYKRFVDKYPSSAMCKRHCLLKMTITMPSNTTK